ncbi:MAG: hypothetical protein LQ338_005348 [Usnochroma carphineum]|nr:MAG: hypothetical protein LQ338_005348 [Usnochroma carphineum]
MASPLQQVQYTSNQVARDTFKSDYNLEEADPSVALNSYNKSIHQYTKSQLDRIKRASDNRRTDVKGVLQVATLTPESSVDSVESVESRR